MHWFLISAIELGYVGYCWIHNLSSLSWSIFLLVCIFIGVAHFYVQLSRLIYQLILKQPGSVSGARLNAIFVFPLFVICVVDRWQYGFELREWISAAYLLLLVAAFILWGREEQASRSAK